MLMDSLPLISKSSVDQGIYEIINNTKFINTTLQKTSRIAAIALATVFSASAKIFYVPIALKLRTWIGGTLGDIVGITSAVCNAKAFFILEMWAAYGIINDILGPRTKAENELTREKTKKYITGLIIVSSLVVALFSQIPYALPAADYDENYKVLAGTVSLIASIFIPTRSIQLSIEEIRRRIMKSREDSGHLKLQNATSQWIEEKRAEFIQMEDALKPGYIESYQEISDSIEYSKTLLSTNKENMTSFLGKCWKYFGKGTGIVLAGLFEYAVASYSFYKTKDIVYDNNILAGVFSVVVTGSTIYLYGKSILATTERIFNSFANVLSCQTRRSLGGIIRPKLNTFLKIEEVVTNIFALGPTFIIWGDFFNKPSWAHTTFLTIMPTTLYLLLLTASLDMIDGITEMPSRNEKEKRILDLNSKFQRIGSVIKNAPTKDFIEFFEKLPRDVQNQIKQKAGFKVNFEDFIEKV